MVLWVNYSDLYIIRLEIDFFIHSVMTITRITKRDFTQKPFELNKISKAILKAMEAVGHGQEEDGNRIAESVHQTLLERSEQLQDYIPTVEEVQDVVEERLMTSEFHDVAKAYILYRNKQAQSRICNIYEKRVNLKPYEITLQYDYVPDCRHSYLIH